LITLANESYAFSQNGLVSWPFTYTTSRNKGRYFRGRAVPQPGRLFITKDPRENLRDIVAS